MIRFAWVLAPAVLAGCSSYGPVALRGEPHTIHPPHAVFDAPQTTQLRISHAPESAVATTANGQPWWATRNDARLNVRPNSNQAVAEVVTIYTRDIQRTTGDRLHDTYRRVTEGVRWGVPTP